MTSIDPAAATYGRSEPAPRAAARASHRQAVARETRMPLSKRLLDVAVAGTLVILLWPLLLLLALLLLVVEGRPILYRAERMATPVRTFTQLKFRTMEVGADKVGGVTGGDKTRGISRLHRVLRRTRLDELPQLWNVLRGDMSLVGPRPPMRQFVIEFPATYARVLQSRPGVTGLATLRFHAEEERLLAACHTPEETAAVYRRECIPRKARLDLMYQRHQSFWLDLRLVAETALRPFIHPEARVVERRSARLIEESRRKGLLGLRRPRRVRRPIRAVPARPAPLASHLPAE